MRNRKKTVKEIYKINCDNVINIINEFNRENTEWKITHPIISVELNHSYPIIFDIINNDTREKLTLHFCFTQSSATNYIIKSFGRVTKKAILRYSKKEIVTKEEVKRRIFQAIETKDKIMNHNKSISLILDEFKKEMSGCYVDIDEKFMVLKVIEGINKKYFALFVLSDDFDPINFLNKNYANPFVAKSYNVYARNRGEIMEVIMGGLVSCDVNLRGRN